ncbi:MAG: SDR family oxidoreductase [Armatimonadetes bacterium]|nr:SDR family oxidoreductase [Anaerolineae bacterium]
MNAARLDGKIALITGANSGLGKATAIGLAQLGARVVMVCRSPERGAAAQAEVIAASGNPQVDVLTVDLASQAAIRHGAASFIEQYSHLHLLVNNAGVSFAARRETVDGVEMSLAVNHLAAFLLTHSLLDVLKSSAPARIINVGTRLNTAMDFDDLQFAKRRYNGLQAYSQSKLGSQHFTYELARRLAGTGVTVNCVHPGVFKSNLGKEDVQEAWYLRLIGAFGALVLPDATRAAERVLYLAASPEVEGVTGGYFGDRQRLPAPAQTQDPAANRRLCDISAALTKV